MGSERVVGRSVGRTDGSDSNIALLAPTRLAINGINSPGAALLAGLRSMQLDPAELRRNSTFLFSCLLLPLSSMCSCVLTMTRQGASLSLHIALLTAQPFFTTHLKAIKSCCQGVVCCRHLQSNDLLPRTTLLLLRCAEGKSRRRVNRSKSVDCYC